MGSAWDQGSGLAQEMDPASGLAQATAWDPASVWATDQAWVWASDPASASAQEKDPASGLAQEKDPATDQG